MEHVEFLVVGGDAAGMTAASAIRRARKDASLLVLEKGPYVSYAACGIPYFLGGEIPELSALEVFTAERFLKERDIEVRNGCEALAIDPQRRTVRVRDASGSELSIGYGSLLLATGANPILPRWPGRELRGVQPLRHLDDAKRADEALRNARRAVVVGGGYVGLEVAENLRKRGLEVTLLEKAPHLMGGLNAALSDAIAERFAEEGVQVRTGVTVTGFTGDDGKLQAVTTDAGELPADFAVVSLGVRPNVQLAQDAGLTLGESGAIAVDAHMRTSDPQIYAAGDCAEALHRVSGKPVFVPLALGANRGGRVAGENMAGGEARFPGIVGSAVTKVFDLAISRTGLLEPDLKRLQMPYAVAKATAPSKAHYYPGHVPVHVELTYDPDGGTLLGALMWGADPSLGKRADVFATALSAGMTVEQVADLDLSYAPPFAPVWDPVLQGANKAVWARKKG